MKKLNEINFSNHSPQEAVKILEQNKNTKRLAEWVRGYIAFSQALGNIRITIADAEREARKEVYPGV